MNTKLHLVISLLWLVLFAVACAGRPTVTPDDIDESASDVASPTEQLSGGVSDLDSLMEALRAAGATVEPGDTVEQPFFTASGHVIKINGADLQVFVYDTAEAMEAEAAQVAEDGGSVGTNMVAWIGPPHFYKLGSMIMLYVGEDQTVLDLLNKVLGPQFAGQ